MEICYLLNKEYIMAIIGFILVVFVCVCITIVVWISLRYGGLDLSPMKWYWWVLSINGLFWMWKLLIQYSPITVGFI
jgi:hypothetical protein